MTVTWCEIMQGAFFRSNREPERKARDFDDNKIVIKPDINQENLTGLSRHANRLRYHTKTGFNSILAWLAVCTALLPNVISTEPTGNSHVAVVCTNPELLRWKKN